LQSAMTDSATVFTEVSRATSSNGWLEVGERAQRRATYDAQWLVTVISRVRSYIISISIITKNNTKCNKIRNYVKNH